MNFNIGQTLLTSINNGIAVIVEFVPKLIVGIIILLIGFIIASLLKQAVIGIFKILKLDALLKRYSVPEAKEGFSWANILGEIVRWFVVIIFLIPTVDVWGLSRVFSVLNQFLLYLPNVFIAAIIALVGLVFAKLVHDLILASAKGITSESARTIASTARWAINVFVFLAVLNQLGVAADLVRILFTGFVAMLAIAGGIAFGLGGQNTAKEALEELKKKLK